MSVTGVMRFGDEDEQEMFSSTWTPEKNAEAGSIWLNTMAGNAGRRQAAAGRWRISFKEGQTRVRYEAMGVDGEPFYFELRTPEADVEVKVEGVCALTIRRAEGAAQKPPALPPPGPGARPMIPRAVAPWTPREVGRAAREEAAKLLAERREPQPMSVIRAHLKQRLERVPPRQYLRDALKADPRFVMTGSRSTARWTLADTP